MEQNCLFVCYDLADQFWLLHLFNHSSIVHIEIRPVGDFSFFVLPELFKLIIVDASISYSDPALAFPPILYLDSVFPLQVFDPVSIKWEFYEIFAKLNWNGVVGPSPRELLQKCVGNEHYSATQRTEVRVQLLGRNRVVVHSVPL